jgi:hypothetical protein
VFVDMATPSETHNACTNDDTRWVDPVGIAAGSYPLHPTAPGMVAMAHLLEAAFKR